MNSRKQAFFPRPQQAETLCYDRCTHQPQSIVFAIHTSPRAIVGSSLFQRSKEVIRSMLVSPKTSSLHPHIFLLSVFPLGRRALFKVMLTLETMNERHFSVVLTTIEQERRALWCKIYNTGTLSLVEINDSSALDFGKPEHKHGQRGRRCSDTVHIYRHRWTALSTASSKTKLCHAGLLGGRHL